MKHFFLFASFLLMALFAQSQDLHVVKDNVNCSYGIKNAKGEWVVEPKYILIEQYNTGYFLVRDMEGIGIFTPSGKELIPCVYDRLLPSNHEWRIKSTYDNYQSTAQREGFVLFYGSVNSNEVVFSLHGDVIGRFEGGTSFEIDDDSTFIAFNNSSRTSAYCHVSGTCLIDSIFGKIALFKGKEHTLVGDYVDGNWYAHHNVRVINKKGEQLLNANWDHAVIDSKDRICFISNKKYGVITLSGDTIIPPIYERKDASLELDHRAFWEIYDTLGRVGIMKNDGTVIVEPSYDQLYAVNGTNRVQFAWMVKKAERFGVIDLFGKEIVPVKYEQVYPISYKPIPENEPIVTNYIARKNGKSFYINAEDTSLNSEAFDSLIVVTDHSYSYGISLTHAVITRREGKLGILHPNGSLLVDCIYDSKFQNSIKNNYFFGKGETLIEYTFGINNIQSVEWLPLISDKSIHLYAHQSRYLAVKKSDVNGRVLGIDLDYRNVDVSGNLIVLRHQSSSKQVIFNSKTAKMLPFNNIIAFNSNGYQYFEIETSSNNHGLIDEDGNLVIDTIYREIQFNYRSSKIWVTKQVGNRMVSMLLDSTGRQVIPNQFDNYFELNSGDQVVSQNGNKGLIDSKELRWKIRPEHFCLMKVADSFYHVISAANKKGIIHANGKIIVPIVYDSIILLYANCQLNNYCLPNLQPDIRWLLRKGSTEFLANQDGEILPSKSAIRSFKSTVLFDHDSLFPSFNYAPNFPVLDYTPSLHFLRGLTMNQIKHKRMELWTNSVIKNAVFDTINAIWETRPKNCAQGYYWMTSISVSGDQQQSSTLADNAKLSCDCLEMNRSYNRGGLSRYSLESIGAKFASIEIFYRNDDGFEFVRSERSQPVFPAININLIEQNGKVRSITLKDVFPSDAILMEEFINALKLRDDLALDCSSMENMLEMIAGNFSLSSEGIYLHLNQYNHQTNNFVDLFIPSGKLANHAESKWIVPVLQH